MEIEITLVSPPLVIIESPYAGEIEKNIGYARAAMRHSVLAGEAPIASHLLYTQEGILDDEQPIDRELGIMLGLAWRRVADYAVFYIDRGWSRGMMKAKKYYESTEFPYVTRTLGQSVNNKEEDAVVSGV